MFYVYLLRSKVHNELYIGSTIDLRRRVQDHNRGVETSTRRYAPWELWYYESYKTEALARIREQRLKAHGNAMKELKKRAGLAALPSTIFSRKNGAGFTLIELLVTASIITLLIGTGIPAFRRFGRSSELELAAEQAKSAVLEARSLALNPRAAGSATLTKPDGSSCTPAPTISSYAIQFTQGGNGYRLLEDSCQLGAARTLPPSVVVDQAPTQILFAVGERGRMQQPLTDAVVKLSHRQLPDGTQRTVTVNHETGAAFIK